MHIRTVLTAIALTAASSLAPASPVTLEYNKTALGGGQFQYDFTFILDNHDGSWTPGQGWDWVVFGDTDPQGTHKSFNTNPGWCDAVDWQTISHDSLIKEIGDTSCGGHNGATIFFYHWGGPWTPWKPDLGDSVSFSGTSTINFLDGEMRWSALMSTGGASAISFEVARESVAAIPEPGSMALLGLALAGLALARRRI